MFCEFTVARDSISRFATDYVSVEDRSVRYVAEENIELILPQMIELPESLTTIAGKHFKRWDETTRSFVSNVRDEYPDD